LPGRVRLSGDNAEGLHYVERKHAQDVRKFHLLQSFHAKRGEALRHIRQIRAYE